jgi:1,4-dihydroxy-2-naphthoate octaprenyltransferase
MTAYSIVLALHSWSRWLVLVFGLIAFFRAFTGWQGRKPYTGADKGMGAAFVGSMHLQLLLGLILYFALSPYGVKAFDSLGGGVMKDANARFFAVEHIVTMILAVVAAQVGRSTSKKAVDAVLKHKRAAVWFGVALLLVLLMIPWGLWNPERPLFRF